MIGSESNSGCSFARPLILVHSPTQKNPITQIIHMKKIIINSICAVTLTTGVHAALLAGQTLGIDFGDGIHPDLTPPAAAPALHGSGSETNFAVMVQPDGVRRDTSSNVNVTGQVISTDITGAALTGVTFSTSGWLGFLASTDQVGYNAAGVGNYGGTPYSDLSFNDGIFRGGGTGVITISGLDDSLTYDLSAVGHMFVGPNYGLSLTDPVSGEAGSYNSTGIINGGTSAGPNPNPITPLTLTGLQSSGGVLTLNTVAVNGAGIISALTVTAVGTTAVPEPSSTVLLGLGGLAFVLRRRR